MGWNSWDCFGTTVTEAQFKANASVMAKDLLRVGYDTATVDIQWYEPQATGFDYKPGAKLTLDGYGRLLPALNKFPSSAGGAGFKTLANWTHKQGLKFGIHLMRGIPRQAVEANMPILGTSLRARDIANVSDMCSWNPDMYGVDMGKPGAQEYYDSVFRQIASWGVDLVKVDDLSRPYEAHRLEIEGIRRAIDRSERKIILSMSPGETPVSEHAHAAEHANIWRISDDFWDSWPALLSQFERLRKWSEVRVDGTWPDADMLPLGTLAHGSRKTNFSIDEQRTLMTLWGIARSPLIIGADLSVADPALLNLLRQKEVVAMNQFGKAPKFVSEQDGLVTWTTVDTRNGDRYVAVFNTQSIGFGSKRNLATSPLNVNRQVPIQSLELALTGSDQLTLTTGNAGDGIMFDHSVWLNPRIEMLDGSTVLLSTLKPIRSQSGYGPVSTTLDPENNPLHVGGQLPKNAISAHAPSEVVFDLPVGAVRFFSECTLTDKALAQKFGGTVSFEAIGLSKPKGLPQEGIRYKFDPTQFGIPSTAKVTRVWPQVGDLIPWHGCQIYRILKN